MFTKHSRKNVEAYSKIDQILDMFYNKKNQFTFI